jgi:hypothetical protein
VTDHDTVRESIRRSRLATTKAGQLVHLLHPVGYTRTLCGRRVAHLVSSYTGPATCSRCAAMYEREVGRD